MIQALHALARARDTETANRREGAREWADGLKQNAEVEKPRLPDRSANADSLTNSE